MKKYLSIVFCTLISFSLNVAAYKVISIKEGARITGNVSFTGSESEAQKHRKMYTITKDNDVCGTGTRNIEYVRLTGTELLDVVVYVEKVKKGKDWIPEEKNITINQKKCEFLPFFSVMANKGDLTAINSDAVAHNMHTYAIMGRAKKTTLNISQPTQDSEVTKKIKLNRRSQGMKVECDQHDFMHSFVFVARNPYYSVVSKEGRFTIEDIPAGKYTLKTWHGYLKNPKAQKITVKQGTVHNISFSYLNKKK